MVASKPRNRVVVFRLSQDEYKSLKEACFVKGGRNLSDFTRSELLAFLHTDSQDRLLEERFSNMELTLAELKLSVQRLAQALERLLMPKREQAQNHNHEL